MAAYVKAQEFNNLRWGTLGPIPVRVGGQILEVRARGTLSLLVAEPAQIETYIENPEDFEAEMRSYFSMCIHEALGELASAALNLEQFLAVSEQTRQLFQAKFDQKLGEMGLQVKSLVLEALEKAV